MHNRFTEEYGLRHPVVQGSLGIASMPALVAAVSAAGGMGTLGAAGWPLMSASELCGLIRAVRALTDRPFGVSFDAELATVDHLQACIDTRVAVVSFDRADPPPHFTGMLRRGGVRVWMKAGSVAQARCAARAGADAVIAHGREGAGIGTGQTATLTLVPAVVDAIWPVPVLASGGIADGRGVAAALVLGADAAWIGTRFLASREANAHEAYKRRVVEAGEGDTAVSTTFRTTGPGSPVRTLRNRVVRQWQDDRRAARLRGFSGAASRAGAPVDGTRVIGRTELGGRAVEIPEFSCILPTPETEGDLDAMCMPAGECATLIRGVRPAAEIVRMIARDLERAIEGATPRTIRG